jgi:hypothetical protein
MDKSDPLIDDLAVIWSTIARLTENVYNVVRAKDPFREVCNLEDSIDVSECVNLDERGSKSVSISEHISFRVEQAEPCFRKAYCISVNKADVLMGCPHTYMPKERVFRRV